MGLINDKVYVSDIDGNDTLIGGAGNDFLELDRSTHDTQFNVTFDAGTPGLIQLADGTEFSGFEQVYFYAGNADDTFHVILDSSNTNDLQFNGQGGNDHVILDMTRLTEDLTISSQFGQLSETSNPRNYGYFQGDSYHLKGGAGNDTYNVGGVTQASTLEGRAGNDALYGGNGNDTLLGGNGNDSIYGRGGNDSVNAGAGNDKVYVSDIDGNDTLIGGAGNDFLELDRSTHDTQFNVTFDAGTPGLIQLADGTEFSGFEQVYFYAGNADDTFNVILDSSNTNDLQFIGGDGNDHVVLDMTRLTEDLTFYVPFGKLSETSNPRNYGYFQGDSYHLKGGAGNDTYNVGGVTQASTLEGRAGNDALYGGSGNDMLLGGTGGDQLSGGSGRDRLVGGKGADTLLGGTGNDTIDGGNGGDRVILGNGSDLFLDNAQTGLAGKDTVFGGQGSDTLKGGGGNDILRGDLGADSVFGGKGFDKLLGGSGTDTLLGGQGNDTLTGGAGQDQLIGGAGSDRFIFANGFGNDTVVGFEAFNKEKISLAKVTGITDFVDLVTNHLNDVGGIAQIQVGTNTILLDGVAFSDVGAGLAYSAEDFIF